MFGLLFTLMGVLVSLLGQVAIWTVRLVVFLGRFAAMGIVFLIAAMQSSPTSPVEARFQRLKVRTLRRPLDSDLRWAIFERDGYSCTYCGSKSDLTIDHVHPVSLGGSNHQANLQTLCRRCNCSKGARSDGVLRTTWR